MKKERRFFRICWPSHAKGDSLDFDDWSQCPWSLGECSPVYFHSCLLGLLSLVPSRLFCYLFRRVAVALLSKPGAGTSRLPVTLAVRRLDIPQKTRKIWRAGRQPSH